MLKFFFLILCMQDSVEPVDVATFKQLYQTAIPSTQAIYDRLFISETRIYFVPNKQQQYVTSGGACGDFLKRSYTEISNGRTYDAKEFLSRENSFLLVKFRETNHHVLQYHTPINTVSEWEDAKSAITKKFPSSFRMPFINPILGLTILEMLDGKPPGPKLYGATYSVDRVEKHVIADSVSFYRVHFLTRYQDQQAEPYYLEVNPQLAWSVTCVKSKTDEYRMEYGDKIDNIPILKEATYSRTETDEETNQTSLKPHNVVEVNQAELYVNVDPKEFDITAHGIPEPPRPLRPGELPIAVWIGIALLFVFIIAVQIFQYTRKKSTPSPPGTVRRLIKLPE